MMKAPFIVVETYAGYKGEDTPRAFLLEGVRLSVVDIVEHWYTDTHSCFRVRASDQHRYVLRYHLDQGFWELVMQEGPERK